MVKAAGERKSMSVIGHDNAQLPGIIRLHIHRNPREMRVLQRIDHRSWIISLSVR